MGTLTIRLPDDKHLRLKELAKARGTSVNKLIEELSTVALAEFDVQTRFQTWAATGNVKRGLELLDKLDRSHHTQDRNETELTFGLAEKGLKFKVRGGNREQGTGNREQGTGNRERGTGDRRVGNASISIAIFSRIFAPSGPKTGDFFSGQFP